MSLKKIQLKAGVNKERTRYSDEDGWFDSDKVRFRQSLPEKIGGWRQISVNTFLGVCRSLHNWITLNGTNYMGVGTHLKFYVETSGVYNDITPLREVTHQLSNPFATTSGSNTVTVSDALVIYKVGDSVRFSGVDTNVGGIPASEMNAAFVIVSVGAGTYTITTTTAANATTPTVGGTVSAGYTDILLGNSPIATASGSNVLTITDTAGGYKNADFVTIIGATTVNGIPATEINKEHEITYNPIGGGSTYTITVTSNASSTGAGGGNAVVAEYQINTGAEVAVPVSGWGSGAYGAGEWGIGQATQLQLRAWSQSNFGEDLIFGPRSGPIYYWDASAGTTYRAKLLASLPGASEVPIQQNILLVSDVSRFVFAFGTNDVFTTIVDPMLVRWTKQEDAVNWRPEAINQAGSIRLSRGSEIFAVQQARQEILVWTDAALYSLQYVGAPVVWSSQLVGENISTASQNCIAYANGVAYWMGRDKFFQYDGRTAPIRCDLRRYIFEDLNEDQYAQVTAGTNEGFHEVWWFYCSKSSSTNDRYVIYNYAEDIWYHGSLGRTAWIDSGLRQYPTAATYSNNLVYHEDGLDDGETALPGSPIVSKITSTQFDLDDGERFMFVWRVLPDLTFDGSAPGSTPAMKITLYPSKSSGSGRNSPASEGGSNEYTVSRSSVDANTGVEKYTPQINTRVRGRQLAIELSSNTIGVQWQLGTPRIDMRPDGRRG